VQYAPSDVFSCSFWKGKRSLQLTIVSTAWSTTPAIRAWRLSNRRAFRSLGRGYDLLVSKSDLPACQQLTSPACCGCDPIVYQHEVASSSFLSVPAYRFCSRHVWRPYNRTDRIRAFRNSKLDTSIPRLKRHSMLHDYTHQTFGCILYYLRPGSEESRFWLTLSLLTCSSALKKHTTTLFPERLL